jgi:protein TonB
MAGRQEGERVFGVLAISVSAHIFVFIGLGFAPSLSEALHARAVEFEVVQPRTLPSKEPIPETKEPAAVRAREEPQRPKIKRVPETPAPPTPTAEKPSADHQAQEQAPLDFAGVTLTAEDGNATWATVVGDGTAIKGPVVTPRKNPARQSSVPAASTSATSHKPAVDLSRPPKPPENLDALLTKYYPERAKTQGIEGQAVLRVRIQPDGRVANMNVVRESYTEFGRACMEHLKSTRWAPAQDRYGRNIMFDITYTCRFEVGY